MLIMDKSDNCYRKTFDKGYKAVTSKVINLCVKDDIQFEFIESEDSDETDTD